MLPRHGRLAAALSWALIGLAPAGAAGAGVAARQHPNLVYNPSFELEAWLRPGEPELWFDRPYLALDANDPRSGKVSLRLTGPAKGYTLQQSVNLIPGVRYVIGAWAKMRPAGGKGVRVAWLGGGKQVGTDWQGAAEKWTKFEATFTAPPDRAVGHVRLYCDLPAGGKAWLDDVWLAPADGKVPVAAAPSMAPPGGTFTGPVHVTLKTPLPGAAIRYTIDGTEPTVFSTLYAGPFRLAGPGAVKARVFHAGHRTSPSASGRFVVRPRLDGGVPFSPAGWDQDVERWWAGHIHNPAAAAYWKDRPASPAPRINVADVRDASPATKTGGILEALKRLPKTGGTLWLPKSRGPYVISKGPEVVQNYYKLSAAILVLRRSHVHFLSDGAVIRYDRGAWGPDVPSGNVAAMFTFSSMEYADRRQKQHPATDFYFEDLVFDGGQAAPGAVVFRHCAEVLFDRCVFRNFATTSRGHPGMISAASVVDNLWCRHCRFEGGGAFGIYYDGVHNAGFVNCRFGRGLSRSAILMMANNDMVKLSAAQRSCQYVVVSGCTFAGLGRECAVMTAANTLVTGCRATGRWRMFVSQQGRGKSNIAPQMRYNGTGIRVVGNTVEAAEVFCRFGGDCRQYTRAATRSEVRENRCGDCDALVLIEPRVVDRLNTRPRVAGLTVRGNAAAGKRVPQVRVLAEAAGRVEDVLVAGNELTGGKGPLLADERGRAGRCEGVRFENNTIRQGE